MLNVSGTVLQRLRGKSQLISFLHSGLDNTIELCLDYKTVDVNAQELQSGNTALHLASSIGRADVVNLLLSQDDIDDTKRNHDGRDALDVALSPEIAQVIQGKSFLNTSVLLCA